MRGVLRMELAWNTQKNQMSDVKGKEMEQERKGKIKNEDIDPERTKDNYDIVESDKTLYQRVKERIEELKESGSRVQKNSVVMYSNVLTVPIEQAKIWGEEKTDAYFKACYDFFCQEFGKENVVSAKVHKDETTPHMHLHFVPVNKENGKLQARIAMNKQKLNYIHDALPKFLQERGFDVVRASGKTKDKNIENVHEFKEVKRKIAEEQKALEQLEEKKKRLEEILPEGKPKIKYRKETEKVKVGLLKTEERETGNVILSRDQFKSLVQQVTAASVIKAENEVLRNSDLYKENQKLVKDYNELAKQYNGLVDEKNRLLQENQGLKTEIQNLKQEIQEIYKITREYLKERTNDFKGVLRRFIDKVKGNMPKGIKTALEGEYERLERNYNKFSLKNVKEMNKGLKQTNKQNKAKSYDLER